MRQLKQRSILKENPKQQGERHDPKSDSSLVHLILDNVGVGLTLPPKTSPV